MKTHWSTRLLLALFLFSLLFPLTIGQAAKSEQAAVPELRAAAILEDMTPEERVGQLFLVTFSGTQVGPTTPIHDLIVNHHVGGLILLAENDNFNDSLHNLDDLWTLTNQLQTIKYTRSQDTVVAPDEEALPSVTFAPLLIGITQEGDGYPNDQILDGLTPLPSQLAIGATWNTLLAERVAAVAGAELSALGINLLFGPSLDVLENPLLQGASELGVRSFGGDPYWVGEMGKAYIRGLRKGSNNRLVVVGTHFPGLGSADHIPQDEVATVRKSLEQLKQIELAPFFAVTGNAITTTEQVDALLTSHIRYQGLQGNIRSTTRPIGFDQQALGLLMEQPAFSSWREAGGVMISDDLGSRAVRRFYDPTEQEFNARRLALDAFLAGNDLLYVNNFIEAEDPDSFTTIRRTLEFFTQKYREDPLFAARVDESVLRILALKFKIYGVFNLNQVLSSGNLNDIGTAEQITFDVAQQGVTLISPSIAELDSILPDTPARTDQIVFISDSYAVQQCSTCQLKTVLSTNALSQAVLNLYGPRSGGQVSQYYLRSYSFDHLIDFLDNNENKLNALENDLTNTNWIIFTMLDVSADRPTSLALQRFLAERPDLISGKRVLVFATNGPNFLNSTEISKLTAYFGLFSKTEPFIDIAARVLFKEIPNPAGDLPVSVPGVGYDLIIATSPNADQNIPILLNLPESINSEDSTPSEPGALLEYRLGDTIPLSSGIILDMNGHAVPNNTPVEFIITVNGEEAPTISVTSIDGIAQAEYLVEQSGAISIHIQSGMASSETLIFEIPFEESEPEPTATPISTEIPTLIPSPTIPVPTPTPELMPAVETSATDLIDWLGALVVSGFMGWGATRTGAILGKVRWGIRWGLSAFIGGLLLYTYVVLDLPGSHRFMAISELWGLLLATFVGAIIGWIVALVAYSSRRQYQ
jgi:beta-N-acetylhexosaminidase